MAFPAAEEMVVAAERQLGRRLPAGHRARLLRNNGGEVLADDQTWMLYPVWDDTNRRTINRTMSNIVRENELFRLDRPELSTEYLVIADNSGGDLLVIARGRDDVLFCDHETGELSPVSVDWLAP